MHSRVSRPFLFLDPPPSISTSMSEVAGERSTPQNRPEGPAIGPSRSRVPLSTLLPGLRFCGVPRGRGRGLPIRGFIPFGRSGPPAHCLPACSPSGMRRGEGRPPPRRIYTKRPGGDRPTPQGVPRPMIGLRPLWAQTGQCGLPRHCPIRCPSPPHPRQQSPRSISKGNHRPRCPRPRQRKHWGSPFSTREIPTQ